MVGRIGNVRMSLETLLEAARFVEQQEKKRERLASSSSSSSDHTLAVTPHSNHHSSSEPRGEYHAPLFGDRSRYVRIHIEFADHNE